MRNVIFDFPLQFVKSLFGLRDADIVDIQSEDGKGDTHEQRGFGVLPGTDAGGFHYNQFAVGKHAVVNERTATNKAIGDRMIYSLGIKSDVISINRLSGSPLLVISSTKRSDWVSQRMDSSEKVTSRKPTKICLAM